MAAHEGLDYDPADGHYSDVVLTIRILMGKVQIYKHILSLILANLAFVEYFHRLPNAVLHKQPLNIK